MPVAGRRRAQGALVLACSAAHLGQVFLTPSNAPTSPLRAPSVSVATAASGSSAAAPVARATSGLPLVAGLGLAAACRKSKIFRRGGGGDIDDVVPFEIRGFSLAQLFIVVGAVLTIISFADYGGLLGFGIGGITFIYAIPVLLLGLALVYAELQPVPVETASNAGNIFEEKATPTLKKILNDVTRHRYGDDAHLDTSLKALGLTGVGRYPQMEKIIISRSPDDELEFEMRFVSRDVPFTTWADPMRIVACNRFFGPGIWTQISKYSSEKRIASLKLTTGTKPEVKKEVPATA